jgi:hypothetical protein
MAGAAITAEVPSAIFFKTFLRDDGMV